MIAIAGGIILAVLFLVFLPLIWRFALLGLMIVLCTVVAFSVGLPWWAGSLVGLVGGSWTLSREY